MIAKRPSIASLGGMLCLAIPMLSTSVTAEDAFDAPDGWQSFSARPEIAPRFWVERDDQAPDRYGLGLAGNGNESVDGRWVRSVSVEAGQPYAFSAIVDMKDVATPLRSVLARVLWFDANGEPVERAEYPRTRPVEGTPGRSVLTGTFVAPPRTAEARLELHLRWAPEGQAVWSEVEFVPASAPEPRPVRLASVNHRPRGGASPTSNVERFADLVEEAGKQGADVVCLPEGITVVGTNLGYAEVAEPIPGPTTEHLGEAARKAGAYVVAGIYEREGEAVYNSSVLINRDGELVGTYRKVCLPREEIDGGITPGTEYPVFETDFGRVGMMICWDLHYPEVARELAAAGAEVIFMPIWGGNETLARARAIENQLYLVASGYDFRTAIYDRTGEPIELAGADPEIILAEIDLNERTMWEWLGDWKARIWREGPIRPSAATDTP